MSVSADGNTHADTHAGPRVGMTFSLAIPHAPWIDGRAESMARLLLSLRDPDEPEAHIFADRAPNHVWSNTMWSWGTRQDTSHFLTLQDDVRVAPDFWGKLRAFVASFPEDVICLQSVHPLTPALYKTGHTAYATRDQIVGVGYCMPTSTLAEFIAWRAENLPDPSLVTEDTLIGMWCLLTGRRIVCPVEAFIDHDTTLVSSYGNDAHTMRRPLVRWDNIPDNVRQSVEMGPRVARVPNLGRVYDGPDYLALMRTAIPTLTPEDVRRVTLDPTKIRELKRITYTLRAQMPEGPSARIQIVTPMWGMAINHYCAATLLNLVYDEQIDYTSPFEISDVQINYYDLVRFRSRAVAHFLAGDATHLLFIDSDIALAPRVVRGMLASGADCIGAPYPRRDGMRVHPEKHTLDYNYVIRGEGGKPEFEVSPNGLARVDGVGMGCVLLSRKLLQFMWDRYKDTLSFDDRGTQCVALFQLILRDNSLLSEDYSFCHRVRECGFDVNAYFGPGSPVDHAGPWLFKGDIGSFGLQHGT